MREVARVANEFKTKDGCELASVSQNENESVKPLHSVTVGVACVCLEVSTMFLQFVVSTFDNVLQHFFSYNNRAIAKVSTQAPKLKSTLCGFKIYSG